MFGEWSPFVAGFCAAAAFSLVKRVIAPRAARAGRRIRLQLKEWYVAMLHRLGIRIDPYRRVWELRRMILLSPVRPKLFELDRRDTAICNKYAADRNDNYGRDMKPLHESVLTSFYGVAVVPNQPETKLVWAQ